MSTISCKQVHHPIHTIVSRMMPYDSLEQEHINDTLAWIESGAPLFRTSKSDVPPKHLVSYVVLFDEKESKILLVDHKKSGLWLPAGGHVDLGEGPREAAARECFEELNIQADFWRDDPFFLTSTMTVGMTPGHIDVSLWYVVRGHHQTSYVYDTREFKAIKWFDFDEIPLKQSDPHMRRFVNKLREQLNQDVP